MKLGLRPLVIRIDELDCNSLENALLRDGYAAGRRFLSDDYARTRLSHGQGCDRSRAT